jgi:TRAP-type C4-dicarboxylate transport system substrate-binding protein
VTTNSTAASPSPVGVIEIRGQSLYGEDDLVYKIIGTPIIDALNQKLAGRYHFSLALPGNLVPIESQFDSLSKGVLQFSLGDFNYDSAFIPEVVVAYGLPGSWQTVDQDVRFFENYGGLEFFRQSYAKTNIYLNYPLPKGSNCLLTARYLTSLNDFRGLKIWSEDRSSAVVKAIGAQPVNGPIQDVFKNMQAGNLDGMVHSEAELKTQGFYRVARYVTYPAIQGVLNANWQFNMDTWKSFPADIQSTIDSTIKELSPQLGQKYAAADNEAVAYLRTMGGGVVNLVPDQAARLNALGRASWLEIARETKEKEQAVQLVQAFMDDLGIK